MHYMHGSIVVRIIVSPYYLKEVVLVVFSVFQEPVLMMELVGIMRFKGPCWSLLISWMGLIQEETLRSSWQQTGRLVIIY